MDNQYGQQASGFCHCLMQWRKADKRVRGNPFRTAQAPIPQFPLCAASSQPTAESTMGKPKKTGGIQTMRSLAVVILAALAAVPAPAWAEDPAFGPRYHIPAPNCITPQGTLAQPTAVVSFEINGRLYCTGLFPPTIGISQGHTGLATVRYVLNNNMLDYYSCQEGYPLHLYVYASAMGIFGKYLNNKGQWTGPEVVNGVNVIPSFRPAPAGGVLTDLYSGYPATGNYQIRIGCFSPDGASLNQGEILISVLPF